ncbi:hypothetical protein ACWGID_23275 [Kribbella sp. NPDC054772]
MNEPRYTQPGDSYASRIPYVVPESLDQLTGPRTGIVELPVSINWGPQRVYDLANADDKLSLYKTVLSEASTPAQLTSLVNKDLLIELWPQLHLPRYCVRRWHTAFPRLAEIGAGGIWQ